MQNVAIIGTRPVQTFFIGDTSFLNYETTYVGFISQYCGIITITTPNYQQ